MSHTSPCAQIASTNHCHHLSHSLCLSLSVSLPPSFRHLLSDFFQPRSGLARLTSKCIHTPFPVALDSLASFDSLSPCLFSSHPGRLQNTSLFQLSPALHTHLVPSKCCSAFAVFTLCAHVLPTPPTLVHSSYLQLSVSLSVRFFFFICISPPTPPLPSLAFTNFHLSSPLFYPVSLSRSSMNISPPFILHPLLCLLIPSSASRLWIPLTFLVRAVGFLTSRDMHVCSCSPVSCTSLCL